MSTEMTSINFGEGFIGKRRWWGGRGRAPWEDVNDLLSIKFCSNGQGDSVVSEGREV